MADPGISEESAKSQRRRVFVAEGKKSEMRSAKRPLI